MIESNPFFGSWWDYWHFITRDSATSEAANVDGLLQKPYSLFNLVDIIEGKETKIP